MWGRAPAWLRTIAAAFGCLGAGFLLRIPIDGFIDGQIPYVTFFPAVLVASLLGGRWAGLIVVVLAAPVAIRSTETGLQFPIAAASVWVIVASAIAFTGGMARSLNDKLRAERDELKRTREQLELVVKELGHRSRNTFAILNALTAQSAQGASSVGEFKERLMQRVAALTAAYSLLTDRGRDTLELAEIAAVALKPFQHAHAAQIDIEPGSACRLTPATGVSMVLCLHELATNAVKYGALSTPEGKVVCSWEVVSGLCRLTWRERGGPPVKGSAPGFGSRLIESALAQEPGGEVDHRFEADGVVCHMTFEPAAA